MSVEKPGVGEGQHERVYEDLSEGHKGERDQGGL